MKLISWNVNGLRACFKKGFIDFFESSNSDVFCVQETKMREGQLDFCPAGYRQYWNSAVKNGYSGTAVFSRPEPLSFSFGIGRDIHDQEGRVITLEFERFYLVNVYTPNSQDELRRLPYRMEWEDSFREYLCALDARKAVIVCGDLNVAHREIDLTHPKPNRRNPGFTDEERSKFSELLDSGFADTFRVLYPDREKAYTWWSYRANARKNNVGWRIDYFICSERLKVNIAEAEILSSVYGSDHCPVSLTLQW